MENLTEKKFGSLVLRVLKKLLRRVALATDNGIPSSKKSHNPAILDFQKPSTDHNKIVSNLHKGLAFCNEKDTCHVT